MSTANVPQILFSPSSLLITHAQDADIAALHNWLDAFSAFPESRCFKHDEEELFIGEHDALFVVSTYLPEVQWGYGSVTFTPAGPFFALNSTKRVFWLRISDGGKA